MKATSIERADKVLDDVFLLKLRNIADQRGDFVKVFHSLDLADYGICFSVAESFISTSKARVIRGMHFQLPPYEHYKLVYCVSGRILDVVVDIRKSSKLFNKPFSLEMSSDGNMALLIGKYYAHGFLSLQENTKLLYMTSTVHSPLHDTGILWSSIDFKWPILDPILSERDRMHPSLQTFNLE